MLKSCFWKIVSLLLITSPLYAEDVPVRVVIEPLSVKVSISTVTVSSVTWITAPTVELRGRREISIFNNSTTNNVYISSVSPSYVYRTLYPREEITFGLSSDVHIFLRANANTEVSIIEVK